MKITENQVALLKAFEPYIQKFRPRSRVLIGIMVAIILVGLYALYLQIVEGHIVTGMRDHVVWGVYIVNFIFFIGVSYGSALLAGFLHVLKVPWRLPVMRIAALTALISAVIGPIFIVIEIARLDRLHYLFMYGRLQSPIFWDVMAISTYFVGTILFVYLLLVRDFAILRDTDTISFPQWRKRLYRFLAINYQDTDEQRKRVNVSTNLIAYIMIPMVVVVSSVLSWIFGMTLRPGWHSTIFGPYFVVAAILSGTGVVIIMLYAFRRVYKLDHYIREIHFNYMGFIMLILAATYGYLTFSEYLTEWFGSAKWEEELVHKILNWDEYGLMFMVSNVFSVVIPILVVAIKSLRKPGWIAFSALLMIVGLWLKRYLIVIPTLETPLFPMQDTREAYVEYTATWPEWALTLAGFATFILFFVIMAKLVTIITVSDYAEKEH